MYVAFAGKGVIEEEENTARRFRSRQLNSISMLPIGKAIKGMGKHEK